MIKKFDCVKFQRQRRTQLSQLLSGMATEDILRYFKAKTPHKRKTKVVVRHVNA